MRTSSDYVPDAFRRLIDSRTEADADQAYWMLDNRVVLQGSLFEASEKLIAPLIAALELDLSPAARHGVLELLTEIALGGTDPSEVALGNSGLADASRAAIRRGLPAIYSLLQDPDPRVRDASIHILGAVELDRRRLAAAAAPVARADPDARVRESAREHLLNEDRR
jgi:HEAT repeat protein